MTIYIYFSPLSPVSPLSPLTTTTLCFITAPRWFPWVIQRNVFLPGMVVVVAI